MMMIMRMLRIINDANYGCHDLKKASGFVVETHTKSERQKERSSHMATHPFVDDDVISFSQQRRVQLGGGGS